MIGWLKQQAFISHILEAGKSKIRVLACLLSGEDPLPHLQMIVLLCPHMAEKEKALVFSSSYKGLMLS